MATTYPISFESYEGIYEVPEAAKYIYSAERAKYEVAQQRDQNFYKVTSRHLIRWIRKGLALETLSDVPGRELLLTFEDMVSMRVIAALRAAGASFKLIDDTENYLREYVGHPRPFAVEALWTLPTSPRYSGDENRAEIFAILKNSLVEASRGGQAAFEFFRDYIVPVHGLTFEDKIAATWEPQDGVLLDPEIQFGAPCIKGTRIPTRTVWGMINAGDAKDYVASSFQLTTEEIEAAIQWEESLTST